MSRPLRVPALVADTQRSGQHITAQPTLPLSWERLVVLLLGSGLALVVTAGIVCVLLGQRAPSDAGSSPGTHEEFVGPLQVLLGDYPDRAWLTYYRSHEQQLGDPRFSERPVDVWNDCVGFTNYVVCHNPNPAVKGTVWEYLPLLLGTRSLPRGVRPDPHAPLAPLVQAYLAHQQARSVDRLYWLGDVQTPALCSTVREDCAQTFQRQVLRWPAGNTDPSTVHVSPLGLAIQSTVP